MTAESLIGNDLKVEYLDTTASPNAYTEIEAATDFGEFGEEKPILDITALASTAREYRNGLADGLEIPLSMNYTSDDADWTFLYNAYDSDTLVTFRIIDKTSSPEAGFSFNATIRGWRVNGPVGEKASASFTLKISGSVELV